MQENIQYYLGFSYFIGIGPITFKLLINHFQTLKKAYNASRSELISVLGNKLAEKFIRNRELLDLKKELLYIQKNNITILTQEDSRYPKSLLNISDAPICLYVKGNIADYNFDTELCFAIVGTRKPSSYGIQIARKFSYELAKEGIVIVSGLAMGIDAVAHTAALDAGYKTIAFLGSGVNVIYPRSNSNLYKRIVDNGGLIISEFPPNMTTMSGLFVQRNRLVSGISKGVLVAEGLKDSGSLITARFAAEQGKDVFAPPSPITSNLSEAPNLLLKEGAKMVTHVNDILEEYKMDTIIHKTEEVYAKLSTTEKTIYDLLLREPFDSDEISRSLNIPVYKILTLLSQMELMGVVEKGSGKYRLVM